MSIRFVAEAFRKGLDGKASCAGATMRYGRDEDGKDLQILSFAVRAPGKEQQTFIHKIPASADPVAGAAEAARLYLITL